MPMMRPFSETRTAFQSPMRAVSVGMVVESDTMGYDSPIISDTWVMDSCSIVVPFLSMSMIILSERLPTDTSPDMTGNWEKPVVLMSSEA